MIDMGTVKQPAEVQPDLYERDFYKWSIETAARIRNRDFEGIDWNNIAEEIESLGRSDKRELSSRIQRVLIHLLKWQLAQGKRPDSWLNTLDEQRMQLRGLLDQSPSLRRFIHEAVRNEYGWAAKRAAREMRLDKSQVPKECPFTPEQVLDDEFFPE